MGDAAPNRIMVVLSPEAASDTASKVAKALGGTVVGEIPYLDTYTIGIKPTDADGLDRAAIAAEKVEGVLAAMPDLMARASVKVEGVPCSVIKDDPAYAGDNARPYEMIGVENAWAIVRASGLTINPVTVGVTDSAFYVGQKELQGDPTIVMTDPLNDATMMAEIQGGKVAPYGGHGDAVAGIIGAGADNGGQVGITSVLGDKRKTLYTRVLGGKYGGSSNVATDASDPTQAVLGGTVRTRRGRSSRSWTRSRRARPRSTCRGASSRRPTTPTTGRWPASTGSSSRRCPRTTPRSSS